jgi:hypothetical protein
MIGSDQRPYDVVLDLIRADENPAWGTTIHLTALRAAVVDTQTKRLVASRFVETPRARFSAEVGSLHAMDGAGRIAFRSTLRDGDRPGPGELDFDLTALLRPSTIVQAGTDLLKSAVERWLGSLPPERRAEAKRALFVELAVTDYPVTEHTGTVTVGLEGGAELVLTADSAPSTVSHHYGNRLTDYVFMASVRQPGEPSLIAVVARDSLGTGAQGEGRLNIHVGYSIYTDASGRSSFALMVPSATATEPGELEIGGSLLGDHLEAHATTELGAVVLNQGRLPSKTALGVVKRLHHPLLVALGLGHAEQAFPAVIIDVTGSYLPLASGR